MAFDEAAIAEFCEAGESPEICDAGTADSDIFNACILLEETLPVLNKLINKCGGQVGKKMEKKVWNLYTDITVFLDVIAKQKE